MPYGQNSLFRNQDVHPRACLKVERDVPARWRCQRADFARNSPGTSSSTFKAKRSSPTRISRWYHRYPR